MVASRWVKRVGDAMLAMVVAITESTLEYIS